MTDTPISKWRDLASKASKWSLQAAKDAKDKGIEVAKATDKMVREELQRQKAIQAEREERAKQEAAEKAAQEAAAAAEEARRRRAEALEREPFIRKFYDEKLNTADWKTGSISHEDSVPAGTGHTTVKMSMDYIALSRSLSSMSRSEVEVLRYADLLYVFGILDQQTHTSVKLSILYNEGHCEKRAPNFVLSRGYGDKHGIRSEFDAIQFQMNLWGCASKGSAIALFLSKFSQIENAHPDSHIVKEFRSKILGGSNWLNDHEVVNTSFSFESSPTGLFLGETESGRRTYYRGEGSVVSIAPPGSGKTQCNVFPNLLSYQGPAIVLDVKGECFEKTATWRRDHIGPVYRFSPLNVAASAKYNPLVFLADDPDVLWEECRLLSELLIIPEDKSDPSWENRARDVVAGIVAWLVRHKPPEQRRIGAIIDVVSKIGWEEFIEDAKSTVELPPLSRLGSSLSAMPEKQLEGVLDAARRHLAVWEGARVERVTSGCDWTPEVLKDGSNSTVYICIPPNEIESYAPLLRVIFAQHMRQLMRELPSPGQTPILFMLDELPRLGPMRPVEEALEVGRQYGIRLWMFAQSLGQFEKAYANAEGMLGSCAVRIYMNPSTHDGTAKRVSEELGYAESILDGSRNLMVEPSTLAGPEYAELMIVFARNMRPSKLKKVFAYRDEPFKSRLVE